MVDDMDGLPAFANWREMPKQCGVYRGVIVQNKESKESQDSNFAIVAAKQLPPLFSPAG